MEKNILDFECGIFDSDGTLIDSMPLYIRVFAEILNEKTGIPIKVGRKFYKETAGTPLPRQCEQILKVYSKTADVQEMVELFFQRLDEEKNKKKFKAFPGTKEILRKLNARGIKLFVTSGSRYQDLEKKLAEHDLLIYFDLIMGSDEIPKGVEHIKIFANWCELSFEEFTQKTFLVGDGPTDMRIAKESGIYAIGVKTTIDAKTLIKAGANEVVKNIKDLVK